MIKFVINDRQKKESFKRRKIIIKVANLIFFKRHSNLFLVLLNNERKHIVTLTAGSCKMGKTKKQKVSPYNLLNMVNLLLIYLNKLKVKYVNFIIRQKISSYFYNFQKLLKMNNIFINKFKYVLKKSHGFIRKRKKRRI